MLIVACIGIGATGFFSFVQRRGSRRCIDFYWDSKNFVRTFDINMTYYDSSAWQTPGRQASWEQPPPPSRSGTFLAFENVGLGTWLTTVQGLARQCCARTPRPLLANSKVRILNPKNSSAMHWFGAPNRQESPANDSRGRKSP